MTELQNHSSERKRRIFALLIIELLVLSLISVACLLYWSLDQTVPLEVTNQPMPVDTLRQEASAGGVVILHIDYCKYINAEGDMDIVFFNEEVELVISDRTESREVGCDTIDFPILIPVELVSGEYRVKLDITHDVNPMRKNVRSVFLSESFILE